VTNLKFFIECIFLESSSSIPSEAYVYWNSGDTLQQISCWYFRVFILIKLVINFNLVVFVIYEINKNDYIMITFK